MQIIKQPPQSPDFNVPYFGLFRSIQALQHVQRMTSIEDVIAATQTAFEDVGSEQLNCILFPDSAPTALRVRSEVFVRALQLSRGSHVEGELGWALLMTVLWI
jgi:hypothetical protein